MYLIGRGRKGVHISRFVCTNFSCQIFRSLITARSSRPGGESTLGKNFGTTKVAEERMSILMNENIGLGTININCRSVDNFRTGLRSPWTMPIM
jgi:hypothetical protein